VDGEVKMIIIKHFNIYTLLIVFKDLFFVITVSPMTAWSDRFSERKKHWARPDPTTLPIQIVSIGFSVGMSAIK
jgi:hypothetical protein